jgi:hypothetical protein
VKIIEKQLGILRHWVDDKTIFLTFQQTLTTGNIPSKITTKYKANSEVIETLLQTVDRHQREVNLSYSHRIQLLIEFSRYLLNIRQLYNNRNWLELERYLNTIPSTLIQSLRQMSGFKEAIKELDNCRWLGKYYNLLQAMRQVFNQHLPFSLLNYDLVVLNQPGGGDQTYLLNLFSHSEEKLNVIKEAKAMELHDEPVFSAMLEFSEKVLKLIDFCQQNKLKEVTISALLTTCPLIEALVLFVGSRTPL